MNKKLIAVAVAGALAAPVSTALAQSSTVQIGGSLNLLYYLHKPGTGGPGKKGDIMEQSEPELYIRGEEKIGGMLGSVWFQCASSFDIAGATGDGFCTRNSAIGVRGNYGNVFAGNWDMPQKLVVNQIRGAFSGTNALYGGGANLLFGGSASGVGNPVQTIAASPVAGGATGASTTNANNAERFYRRQARSWNYHSPSWSGLQFQGAFSTATEHTGLGTSPLQPRLYSLAVHYNNGPLYLGAAYEQHQDWNPGNTTVTGAGIPTTASNYGGGDDNNWTLGAGYTFAGVFKLTGMYSRSEYDTTNTGGIKVKGFALYADWRVAGPHIVRAQYARVDDVEGNTTQGAGVYKGPAGATCGPTSTVSCASSTGADLWGIHYAYQFSKRTEGIIAYNRVSNDSGATYSLGKSAAPAGSSQSAMGIALKHRF